MNSAKTQMNRPSYPDLQRILEGRRQEILSHVQERIRDARDESAWGKTDEVLDAGERIEADIQKDMEFALIQMKLETLHKINEALARLDEGTYGYCFDCGEEISEQRLRALLFAVRCKECEEAREVAAQRERLRAPRGAPHAWVMPSAETESGDERHRRRWDGHDLALGRR